MQIIISEQSDAYNGSHSGEQYTYTDDLGLAAYLLCVGYTLDGPTKIDEYDVVFAIHEDLRLDDITRGYYEKSAAVDPQAYFQSLIRLKSQIDTVKNKQKHNESH